MAMVSASEVARLVPTMCLVVEMPAKYAGGIKAAQAQPVMHSTSAAASRCQGLARLQRSAIIAAAAIAAHSGISHSRPRRGGS